MIAFILELYDEKQYQFLGLKKRWLAKARLAKNEFPGIMSQLQNRYKNLGGRVYSSADRMSE